MTNSTPTPDPNPNLVPAPDPNPSLNPVPVPAPDLAPDPDPDFTLTVNPVAESVSVPAPSPVPSSVPNVASDPVLVPVRRVDYGVRAARSTFPRPRPAFDTGALVEVILMQLCTWVTDAYGVEVPEAGVVTTAGELSSFISRVTFAAKNVYECEGRVSRWGVVHLLHLVHAEKDIVRAAEPGGDAYLLGALYSLIGARAALDDHYPGTMGLSPFPAHYPVLSKAAWMEAIRAQVLILVTKANVYMPERGEMWGAVDVSVFIAEVADEAEARYGNRGDADSSRGLEHIVNARAHALKAADCHDDAYLFACLGSLIFAVANLGTL